MIGSVSLVAALCLAACCLIAQGDAKSYCKKTRLTNVKLVGFDWKNCGQPDAPAVLKTLKLSPDPITIPGDLTAVASGSTSVVLSAPLSVNVTMEKEVAGFWVKIPCLEELGSCHYRDACDLLDQLIPPGQDCPEPLHTYGLPCHCPFKAKKSKGKKGEKTQKDVNSHQDGGGTCGSEDVCLEKQLERFEWQLRILKEVLSANGNLERAELLKDHTHEDLVALVQGIADKVRTETAADLNILHEQKSKNATEEHERNVEELQRRHEQEKTLLTEKFQAAEDILKVKVDELTAELQVYNELKRRVEESTFKKDLQRNIQAYGSPGAFWESEQESLLFVIEMKTERVQEQARKLFQMEALAEKNASLQDQIIHILQQNEDLGVRIDNYQSLIQQLSREQQDLKGALERQAAVNQKLSQEKEQLMFKLRHRDSCPTILLPAILPEFSPQ
ncbi:coiled-coil domain-containing protein 69-like [Diretmus argenteus]